MRFENVDNETKKNIIEEAIISFEKAAYEGIIKLGLDPNLVDPDSFDPEESGHPEHELHERIALKKVLLSLKILNTELELNS